MSLIFKNLKKKETGSIFESLKEKNKNSDVIPSKNKETLSGMFLPNNYVAIPHFFSQTAIYAPRGGDRNVIHKRVDIWSQGGMNISYEGPLLDTNIDIKLMSLVLKARDTQNNNNNMVYLDFKKTMKQLGLNPLHPNSRDKFIKSVERHLSAKFYFFIGDSGDEKEGFWRSFFIADETTFSYEKNILKIKIGEIIPKLFKMRDTGSFSIEDMVLSFAAKSSYTYKLYSYYESNTTPFPIKVSTILEICDKKLPEGKKPTNNHRKVIKEALDELKKLSFLSDWYFDEEKDKRDPLVIVKKIPRKERQSNLKEINFKSDYMKNDDTD